MITERTSLPLSVGISAANTHDSQGLESLVPGIPVIRSRRGLRHRRPAMLHAGKGYDYDLRQWLRPRRIVPLIARKGVESSQRLGCHRWTVERTVAWPAGCRRLYRRYERKADRFLTFVGIADALICTAGGRPDRRGRQAGMIRNAFGRSRPAAGLLPSSNPNPRGTP
ncbi:Transposase DDE domain-containing protein [Streptomyces sp. DI166]|nr:Transposase DDE domain-containing protein [Streptomyces sp. DI166]